MTHAELEANFVSQPTISPFQVIVAIFSLSIMASPFVVLFWALAKL